MSTKISRHELFLQGAPHYLQALTAIEAFDSEVWRICKDIYDRYKGELETWMGLSQRDCERFTGRDLPSRAEIGAARPTRYPDTRFYLSFVWREDEERLEVAATVWLEVYPKRDRERIFQNIVRKNVPCMLRKDDSDGVSSLYLEKVLAPDQFDSAGAELDDLVRVWLSFCKSIDGLKLIEEGKA